MNFHANIAIYLFNGSCNAVVTNQDVIMFKDHYIMLPYDLYIQESVMHQIVPMQKKRNLNELKISFLCL